MPIYNRGRIPEGIIPLCECGCGTPVGYYAGKWKRFVTHHNVKCGAGSPAWKGGEYVTVQGYVLVYHPGHHRGYRNYVKRCVVSAETKIGRPLLKGEDVHHLDRDRRNDSPDNLAVLSHSEHMKLHRSEDKERDMAVLRRGETTPSSKLTNDAVATIRATPRKRGSIKALAKLFSVSRDAISDVLDGKTWRHVA